jgi:acyl carrier protein
MDIFALVLFMEERYRILVYDKELTPNNLDTMNKLSAFVKKKR